MVQKRKGEEVRRDRCWVRTREVRGDGVGEVGVPDVAVALPQLHLLQHRLRLRPRHLVARILLRRRPLAVSLAQDGSSGSARTPRDGCCELL